MKKENQTILIVVLSLVLVSIIVGAISSLGNIEPKGNTAVIKIQGVLVTTGDDMFSSTMGSSQKIVEKIQKANEDSSIENIVFEINSPGGSPVASDEIGRAIKESEKTTIAWIREVGASGGYWVASSADHIIANRMSITGSIGSYSSFLEFSGFMDDKNISYNLIRSGEYKNMGSPFKEMTDEEQELLQTKIDKIKEYFVTEIAENRDMQRAEVQEIATGEWFLGSEAKDLGLVDELGSKQEVIAYLTKEMGKEPKFVDYSSKPTLFNAFMGASSKTSYSLGKGIGDSLVKNEGVKV